MPIYEPYLAQGLNQGLNTVASHIEAKKKQAEKMALQAALLGAGVPLPAEQLTGQDIAMNPDEYNVMGNPRQMQGIAGLGQVG